jgi:ATP-dependent DNA ligase
MLRAMPLPFPPPVEPMLAKSMDQLPHGEGWIYEPKWDGFRTLVFRDGDDVHLQSRDLKPMNRYFPELVEPIRGALPDRAVVDGELVIAGPHGLEFETLQQRIHPAASRVKMLAAETPASYVAFDLLAVGDEDLRDRPFSERRARLEALLDKAIPPIHLTPATTNRGLAEDWFHRFEGAGLDGVMAKRVEDPYVPGKRIMQKIKHQRTADCVVAGFRWHKNGEGTALGSLLLGLFDDEKILHHVGVIGAFPMARRKELVAELAPLRENALADHPWKAWAEMMTAPDAEGRRVPGEKSRWSRDKDLSWEPLRPERVVEVSYDHMQGSRFRHTAQFVRWRPDKPTSDCTYEQLEVTPPMELAQIFGRKS